MGKLKIINPVILTRAAADEVDNLQQYVHLLAQQDMAASAAWNYAEAPFLEAAFDLGSAVPDLAQSGMQDLIAFLSPAQHPWG